MGLILLIVLIVLLFGTAPTWPHSRNWGYGPSGGLGLVLIILLVLLFTQRVPFWFSRSYGLLANAPSRKARVVWVPAGPERPRRPIGVPWPLRRIGEVSGFGIEK